MYSDFSAKDLWGRKCKLVSGPASRVEANQILVMIEGKRTTFSCFHWKQMASGGYEVVIDGLLSSGQLVMYRGHGREVVCEVVERQRDIYKLDIYRYKLRPVPRP